MNLRPLTAGSDDAIHAVWRLPAADAMRGHRALWWTIGPAGELAVLLVHRRYLNRSRYIKGWVRWRPQLPFTGELVTIIGQEQRRILVKDIRMWPSHLALLSDRRLLLVKGVRPAASPREPGPPTRWCSRRPERLRPSSVSVTTFQPWSPTPTEVSGRLTGTRASTAATPSRERASQDGTPRAGPPGLLSADCPTTHWKAAPRRPRTNTYGSSGTPATAKSAPT